VSSPTGNSEKFAGRPVLVVGLGRSGVAAARALVARGAVVTVSAGNDLGADPVAAAAAADLEGLGVVVRSGSDAPEVPGAGTGLVVLSPGVPPHAPLWRAAVAAGVPVWGEVELAWRLRTPRAGGRGPAPWLGVTGTNGKTTTVGMLASILTAAGLDAVAAGNVGTPLVEVVTGPDADTLDVLAVELSSAQLHSAELTLEAAAVLNLAPDHLDWHGDAEAYAAAKARIWDRVERAAIHNADDPATVALRARARPGAAADTVSFTLGLPGPGQLGLVEELLVDRAFSHGHHGDREGEGTVVATLADLPAGPAPAGTAGAPAPHVVADALAAAALARAHGVPAAAVAAGLRAFQPAAHRLVTVASSGGITWVDDSKATNAHAALAAIGAFTDVVWIAGGLAKGAEFDDLVRAVAGRLRGVVLLGRDRAVVAAALARHAPGIPVRDTGAVETDAMVRVVAAAAELARPGDTVLLAPACASWDQFRNYGHRGDAFAAEVRALTGAGRP
jgi:UDP-N-acetylmuramoylalanine--D-glutamate ligase